MSVVLDLQKDKLREAATAVRRELAAEGNEARNAVIRDAVRGLAAYQNAKLLLTYFSTPLEVDTRELILQALAEGKQVALPCCDTKARTMDFYTFSDVMELLPGKYNGIYEPPRRETCRVTDFSDALCLVPMLAADGNGNRLGYGGGYYDRFLAAHPSLPVVGLCFAACRVVRVPADTYDIPLAQIITDESFDLTSQRES